MRNLGIGFLAAVALLAGIGLSGPALADLEFDQDVTPDAIFGGGNANGSFTTDRNGGVEIGLRGKLRHPRQNVFNSNGDGTYSFNNIVGPGQAFPTAEWSFEWSVNTDIEDPALDRKLDALRYEIGLDGDPGFGTRFLKFDPINLPCADHAIGDNDTPNGGGTELDCGLITGPGDYADLIANNNVAQNSWKYTFFLVGPLENFDPTAVGIYNIYLLAKDSKNNVIARSDIQILVGDPDEESPPVDMNDCKKGGWATFNPPFKNQGDCVNFVTTGK